MLVLKQPRSGGWRHVHFESPTLRLRERIKLRCTVASAHDSGGKGQDESRERTSSARRIDSSSPGLTFRCKSQRLIVSKLKRHSLAMRKPGNSRWRRSLYMVDG